MTTLTPELAQRIAAADRALGAGDLVQARAILEEAARLDPPSPDFWQRLATVRKMAGVPVLAVEAIDRALALAHVPDPDLLIRTGGELRISNFLLWQAAYAELHFTGKLWPEFDEAALDEAIAVFRTRERRFGQTSAQLAGEPAAPDQPMKAA